MNLISLHEPWATLMMLKFKRVETRDWWTNYRGPLAIHASKHGMSLEATLEVCLQTPFYNALMNYPPFRERMIHYRIAPQPGDVDKRVMKFCFPNRGKIVAVVDVKAMCPTSAIAAKHPTIMTAAELAFGNYDPIDKTTGKPRHGWITEFMFEVPEPVPFTSKQGLVHLPEDTHAELKRQWRATNL